MLKALLAAALVAGAAQLACVHSAAAQETWNPFREREEQERAKRGSRREAAPQPPAEPARPFLPPMEGFRQGPGQPAPAAGARPIDEPGVRAGNDPVAREPLSRLGPPDEKSRAVERDELAPVMAGDGSGLPHELWRGLDLAKIEELMARLEIPPRSAALHTLWKRLVTADIAPPAGSEGRFQALRLEALYRSGLIGALSALADKAGDGDPLLTVYKARAAIGAGDRAKGCELAKSLAGTNAEMPKRLRGEIILMGGYCAAAGGNAGAAGLAAELAREDGHDAELGLQALDALAAGQKPAKLALPKRVSLLEYRLLELAGGHEPAQLIDRAEPALLAALALDAGATPQHRLAAGEAAARLNAIEPEELAGIYRAQTATPSADQLLAGPAGAQGSTPQRRAALVKAAEAERTPFKKVRLIRAALDDARRAGLYMPMLQMLARAANGVQPVPEIGWFAETGVEVSLAAGEYDAARRWAAFGATQDRPGGAAPLQHWLALADIADPKLTSRRGDSLATVEELALRGRFGADLLHRLATVLDALDTNVPIPLWEAASRTPQPAGGHLPETGVLSELQDAGKKKEFGRTVLLAMRALGPNGAEGAHMIALGDAIRSLKRAGLEADARRLGFEALFAGWPRAGGG